MLYQHIEPSHRVAGATDSPRWSRKYLLSDTRYGSHLRVLVYRWFSLSCSRKSVRWSRVISQNRYDFFISDRIPASFCLSYHPVLGRRSRSDDGGRLSHCIRTTDAHCARCTYQAKRDCQHGFGVLRYGLFLCRLGYRVPRRPPCRLDAWLLHWILWVCWLSNNGCRIRNPTYAVGL